MFVGELQAEALDSPHHNYLKLVRNFRHEALDLLHEPVDAALVTGLEEGSDGKGSDAPVRI